MTREEAAKLLPIIKAYSEGKTIQHRVATGKWYDAYRADCNLSFEAGEDFRIKPSPKFRPFANAEECWNEMLKHQPFGWVISKEYKKRTCLDVVPEEKEFRSFLKCYTFTDGQPFGIKEEK